MEPCNPCSAAVLEHDRQAVQRLGVALLRQWRQQPRGARELPGLEGGYPAGQRHVAVVEAL